MTAADLAELLELAQAVGYQKREMEEADELSRECGRHPYYEDKLKGEQAYYEEMQAQLRDVAGRLLEQE